MSVITQQKVYIQRYWTDLELLADGFRSYLPIKRVTMACMLPMNQAPKNISTSGNTITAQTGYWIIYTSGDVLKETLGDYKSRPIDPAIFNKTYRRWSEPNMQLTITEEYLQRLGCKPYCKTAHVWAKQVTSETWVQSILGLKPSIAPVGDWLCVGMEGEPWTETDEWFHSHYELPS